MDRILELQKVESMRKMMLMQEQVFKQQVEELHRIYNLQKKLMQETKRLTQLTELIEAADTTKSESAIRHQAAVETIQSFNGRNDPKELSCSHLVKFDLEMPAQTESRSTPSSSIHPFEEKNGLKKMEDEEEGDVGVELTLSIGRCTRKQRSKSHFHNCSTELQDSDQQFCSPLSKTEDTGEALYGQPSSIGLSSLSVYQENRRPHWLLQDLNLNRT